MRKRLKKAVTLLLCMLLLLQSANVPALAAELAPEYRFFTEAPIPADAADNMFFFGSQNMTVSEKSQDHYMMKVVRSGSAEDEAAVTVKFTDLSANYGENYTVSVYGDKEKPQVNEERISMVDFVLENSATQEELAATSNEELAEMITASGGFETLDANGQPLSSVTVTREGQATEEQEAAPDTEAITEEQLYAPQTITSENEDMICDVFPGTELRLNFAAGEREKYVVVTPKYSKKADGDCQVILSLKNPSAGYALTEEAFTSYLNITDEDEGEEAVLSLAEKKYVAAEDSISVTVTRRGAINEMVSVNICTVGDTAEAGRDFPGMDAELYFPMGIESRTVEIPVHHTNEDEALTFDVKLVNPVNCSTELNEAQVTITKATEAQLSLALASSSTDKYDKYLAPRLWPNDFSCFGNAWNTDANWFKYSCKGVDYDTWNGGTYNFINPYLYDGIRITWEAWHDWLGSTSYTYINTDNGHVWYSEENEWDSRTDYVIFNKTYNKELWIGSLTSYFNGIQVNVKNVRPIYRSFNFNLVNADPLEFRGVDKATAQAYTAAQFADQLTTVKSINSSVNGCFTVAAAKSEAGYARLVGLQFLDKNNEEIYYLSNNNNVSAITVDVTEELLAKLACASLKYDKQDDGRYIGNITVKPVFDYIDAAVTVKPATMGAFKGELAVSDTAQTLNYHLGDRLNLSSTLFSAYKGKYVADGVRFERRDAEGKLLVNGSGQLDYDAADQLSFTVDAPALSLTPTFRENDNAVRVQVLKRDVDNGVFDTKSGIFAYNSGRSQSGDYYIYTVSAASVHLDQLVTLNAQPKSASRVSLWSLPGTENKYSGNTFYFSAGRDKADNLLTLSTATAASYNFSGYVFNADKNLSTGNASLTPIIPADGALVCAGEENTLTDEEGGFTLSGVVGSPNSRARVMIFNNNSFTFKEVTLGTARDYDLGLLTAAANSQDSAYFTNIYCYQDGRLITATDTLGMNGQALTIYATVQDGNKYIMGGQERKETVTGVTFYVLDGATHEVKSSYPAQQDEDGLWSVTINRFSPDNPDNYYYGDCFYVAMTTDRVCSEVRDEDGEIPEAFLSTSYAMLSTGYTIIKDQNYKPQKFSMTLPVDANSVILAQDVTAAEDGSGTKKNYATFPFIGSLDFHLGVKGFLKAATSVAAAAEDTEEYDEDDDFFDANDENDPGLDIDENGQSIGGNSIKTQIRITFSFEALPYGGTRFKVGLTVIGGNQAWGSSMGYNPHEFFDLASGAKESSDREMIYNNRQGVKRNTDLFKASFGSPRMSFTVSFGAYIDFAIIQTTDLGTGATTGLTDSDWVFMGAGGFLGGSFTVEYQWPIVFPVIAIPGYLGVIGNIGATGYLGASKDPDKVLKYSDMVDEDNTFNTDQLHFNVDVTANASLKGYIGVLMPDVLGARVIVGFQASFAYSPYLEDYYKQVEDTWGLGAEFTVGGQIDLIITRIPVDGFSVPLFSAGFTEYFVNLKRSNKLVDYTLQAIEERGENYSESYLTKAKQLSDTLAADITNEESLEKMQADFQALLSHVYSDSIQLITKDQRNSVYMITPYDIWLTSKSAGSNYQHIQHTDSKWLGDRGMIENGAFQEAVSQLLVRDSYTQSSSKLLDIGNDCMLSVFLMDTSEKGEIAKPTLVYTVYNTKTEEWTKPQPIQNDGTIDYTPNLCDAGDKVVISWASAKKPYEAYETDSQMMQDMEIYSICFDKKSQSLMGEAQQLTNDEYMDYQPSVIYDSESGDMAIYYLKSSSESLDVADYITAESLVCYRLFDAASASWVLDYYANEYPNYSEAQRQALAKTYGGQRFLSSAVGDDLPISDLTVCEGYNGLGLYAYTVDTDGDTSTTWDTELYARVYDFRSHNSYKPIRITNDKVSQAKPQLIRNNVAYKDYYDSESGEDVSGTTYLFWLENDNQIKYISLTDLIRNGINSDGTLKEENYTLNPVHINTSKGENQESAVSSYQALTDNEDNLYIVWTEACATTADKDLTNMDINKPAALEIYAAAQIRNDAKGQTFNQRSGEGGVIGGAWSAPYRLTRGGKCNDSVAGLVAENGKLYLTHNRYSVTYIGGSEEYLAAHPIKADGTQSGNPYEISSMNLMLTSFEPIGTVSATEFSFSEENPLPGDTVTVTAKIENTGLTTAQGYSLSFYESKNGRQGKKLASFKEKDCLVANAADEVSFDWTIPEDFAGMSVLCVAEENGYDNTTETYSDPLEAKAEYEVNIIDLKQSGDHFVAEYSVTNRGNAAAPTDDVLEIDFAALYGRYDTMYGLETPLLASVKLFGLAAGESRSFNTEFSVPDSAFAYCGYDQALFTVKNGQGQALSDTQGAYLTQEAPSQAVFTNGEQLNLEQGQTEQLGVDLGSRFLQGQARVIYSSDNTAVAAIDEKGQLTAAGAGSAIVTAHILPYGREITLPVTVSGNGEPEETIKHRADKGNKPDEEEQEKTSFRDVKPSDYYYDPILWAVEKDITKGMSKTQFAPDIPCTRAQMVTFLWRAAGCPESQRANEFSDVPADSWYAQAVSWAAEKGIAKGTGEGKFSPKEKVNRAQSVTFLYRFAAAPAPQLDNPFTDVHESDYYYEAVLWAAESGITQGTSRNSFSPLDDCTRGQIVTFLYRYLEK